MKIEGWECYVSPDGLQRAASHQEEGNIVYVHNKGLIAHCACPPEVLLWVLRPLLRLTWDAGYTRWDKENPFNSEPPNKDKDPS